MNDSTYNSTQGAALPLLLDFDAVVTFSRNISSLPGPRDLFTIMQATEDGYQTFIMNYVWTASPEGSIFFDTMRVIFTAKAGQF